MNIYVMSGISL